jgi:hypothetical protein
VSIPIPEAYNIPRQQLPIVYYQNAAIDVIRTRVILEQHSMSGKNIYGYVMKYNFDIDSQFELRNSINYLTIHSDKKRFCFDIDGIIANIIENNNYTESTPIKENIIIVNKLYEMGHYIILFTARGSETGHDWKELTEKQMKEWSVKYNLLLFGKPASDFYIDDKLIDIESLKKLL